MKEVYMKRTLFLCIASLLLITACASPTPAPTITPPVPTMTPLPKPSETPPPVPTSVPVNIAGEWFTLSGNDPTVNITTIVQSQNSFSGETTFKNGEKSMFKGVIDEKNLTLSGTWKMTSGGSGTFTMHFLDGLEKMAGLNSNGYKLCLAREKAALPKVCNWD
jgi:hypothetical protein